MLPQEYYDLANSYKYGSPEYLRDEIKDRMEKIWSDYYGLKRSKGRDAWWGNLIGHKDPYTKKVRQLDLPSRLPCDDHPSLWNKNGKAALWLSQPYDYDQADIDEAAEKFGLTATIADYPSWYAPNDTKMILWRKAS